MKLDEALNFARPGSQWAITANDYDSLDWRGPGEKPTLEELQAAWASMPAPAVVVPFRSLAFALLEAGLYSQVKAAALATPQGEIWWNTAQSTTVSRDHPFVAALASAVGQTPEEIDAIFAAAALQA